MLLTKEFEETLLQGLEIRYCKVDQSFIVKVEKEVLLWQLVTHLLEQDRLATTSDTCNNQYLRCGKPFFLDSSRNRILRYILTVFLLFEYNFL